MAKILVIDDEAIIRDRLKSLLMLDDFDAYSAENGVEGIKIFEAEAPDVIVADIKMPKMDGIEVLRRVKAMNKNAEVIFITGHGGVDTAIEAMKEGAFGYIQKPVEYDELKIEIDKAIERQTMQGKLDAYVRELQRSVDEWEITFNCVKDCLSIHDEDFNIIKTNKAFIETFGFSEKELNVKPCYELFGCIESDVSQCLNIRSRESRVTCVKEMYHQGLNKYFEITVSPIFTKDGEFKGSVHSFKDITARKLNEEKIKASLEEKTLLLREIHHRVKNNMEIISNLIELNIDTADDQKVIDMSNEMKNRIRSMSLVHQSLYQNDNLSHINFRDYTKDLTADILNSYSVEPSAVSVTIDINDDVYIGMDTAMPCCLIINELITNSIKHAFKKTKEGRLYISMKATGHQSYELIVRDNGGGIPEGFDISKSSSLGLTLIKTLGEYQLGGKIEINGDDGMEFKLSFKELQYRKRI
ncbi:MAG: response regulator [Candidatus Magnetominusculus sp. LBB02]|nr:response regulator [Candidatus Magnetominusculus sp. LBB02]